MGIRQHISEFLKDYKRKNELSTAAFAAKLGISCSTLQTYLKCTGNPTADTIEHMARSIGVDPAVLVCSSVEGSKLHFVTLMAECANATSYLSPRKKQLFSRLASAMIALWDENNDCKDLEEYFLDKQNL